MEILFWRGHLKLWMDMSSIPAVNEVKRPPTAFMQINVDGDEQKGLNNISSWLTGEDL